MDCSHTAAATLQKKDKAGIRQTKAKSSPLESSKPAKIPKKSVVTKDRKSSTTSSKGSLERNRPSASMFSILPAPLLSPSNAYLAPHLLKVMFPSIAPQHVSQSDNYFNPDTVILPRTLADSKGQLQLSAAVARISAELIKQETMSRLSGNSASHTVAIDS